MGCDKAAICDDVEAYRGPSLGPWRVNTANGATITPDETHAYSGKQSLKLQLPAGIWRRAQLIRSGAPLFPLADNTYWGRVMMWAADLPRGGQHIDYVQADGEGPGQYRVSSAGSTVMLTYEPHDCYLTTSRQLPQGRWACVEWLMDGRNNVMELHVDGQLQARVAGTGQGCVDGTKSTWVAPRFQNVRIGWFNFQATSAPSTLWLDDLALDARRIGCAPPKGQPR